MVKERTLLQEKLPETFVDSEVTQRAILRRSSSVALSDGTSPTQQRPSVGWIIVANIRSSRVLSHSQERTLYCSSCGSAAEDWLPPLGCGDCASAPPSTPPDEETASAVAVPVAATAGTTPGTFN